MKIISNYGRYKCPNCSAVVDLEEGDLCRWSDPFYYDCLRCGKHLRVSKYNFDAWLRGTKKDIEVDYE